MNKNGNMQKNRVGKNSKKRQKRVVESQPLLILLFAEQLPKVAVHIKQICLFAYHLVHKKSVLVGDHFC